MSAQVIAALRRRANALEDEGLRVAVHGETPMTGSLGTDQHPRSAPVLFFLAAEFRALADEAEGYKQPGQDQEQP